MTKPPRSLVQSGFPETTPEVLSELLPGFDSFEFVGQGGMGAVYRARQVSLDRVVAVKLLAAPEAGKLADFAARFETEARAMARLSHPNVVAVHDYGVAEGQPYLVMEFVEGEDLATRLARSDPLPPEEARRIALDVSEALAYAHGEGVIHRDLKPSNILLGRDGRVRLADFGLAKIEERGRRPSLTLSNTSMGSLDYAAPEVIERPATADARADLYSLGVVLYEMLTGTVPRGLFKLPSEKVPGLDPRFDAIICRAVEEDPEDRYSNVETMRAELGAIGDGDPAKAGNPRGRLLALAVAGALAVLLVAAFFLFGGFSSSTGGPGSARVVEAVDGEWSDVLPRVDLDRDVAEGYWKRVGGVVATRHGLGRNQLAFPVSLEGPCDVRFRISRNAPSIGTVNLVFRFGGKAGQFTICDYAHPHAGIANLDGKPAKENGFAVFWPTPFLLIGEPREFVLRLREKGISAECDGCEFYRWEGEWSDVSPDVDYAINPDGKNGDLSVVVSHGLVSLHGLEVRFQREDAGRLLPDKTTNPERIPPEPPVREHAATGHRYQFIPGDYAWEEARRAAQSLGGQLVTLDSREEQEWVWRTFSPWLPAMAERNLASRGWWTGARRATGDSEWMGLDGKPLVFEAWASPPEPNGTELAAVQHHLPPEGVLSGWTPRPLSTRLGFVVEWEPSGSNRLSVTETETRDFAAWLFRQPRVTLAGFPEVTVPDLMVEGGTRNLQRISELPQGNVTLTRVRLAGLRIDEEARAQLEVLGRMPRLYDLRLHSASDAEVLLFLKDLPRLGTIVLTAEETGVSPMDDSLLAALAGKPLLGILRLDGWSRLTGTGLSHLSAKTKLRTLTMNDCPDLSDTGLAGIAKFTNLEVLSLSGSTGFGDAGLGALKSLRKLRSLGLERTKVSETAVAALRAALPDCTILK